MGNEDGERMPGQTERKSLCDSVLTGISKG